MNVKTFLICMLALFFLGVCRASAVVFSKETFTYAGVTMPYRKVSVVGEGDKTALVVYLHGGTARGSDNEAQIREPAVDSIVTWLMAHRRKAVVVVPQCAKDKTWLGTMQGVVKALLQTFVARGVADASHIYIFGGSMGGTGTWNMVAAYPGFFAAAMPVAGNPSGLEAASVAQTPVYTVMGTADAIMEIPVVEAFLTQMDACGGVYKMDTEDGWTHEDTCKKSYTGARLEWVFGHTLGQTVGVDVSQAVDAGAVATRWYSMAGQRLPARPARAGVYLRQTVYSDGHVQTCKMVLPMP